RAHARGAGHGRDPRGVPRLRPVAGARRDQSRVHARRAQAALPALLRRVHVHRGVDPGELRRLRARRGEARSLRRRRLLGAAHPRGSATRRVDGRAGRAAAVRALPRTAARGAARLRAATSGGEPRRCCDGTGVSRRIARGRALVTFQVSWRQAPTLEPPPPEDDRRSEAFRATLDDALETRLFGELVYRSVRRLGARHVLDVGCGVGTPTLEAAHAGAARVVGVDLVRENVARARANIRHCRLDGRVSAHHASWRDVVSGRFAIGDVDLVVSYPPYVPGGRGSAVDGGPRGTSILDAIVDGVPGSVHGLALLFGSLSDPLQVIARLHGRGFAIRELLLESVPFG